MCCRPPSKVNDYTLIPIPTPLYHTNTTRQWNCKVKNGFMDVCLEVDSLDSTADASSAGGFLFITNDLYIYNARNVNDWSQVTVLLKQRDCVCLSHHCKLMSRYRELTLFALSLCNQTTGLIILTLKGPELPLQRDSSLLAEASPSSTVVVW